MQALVSIIIPTKDRCELLAETLESLRAQTVEDWEAIVVDDGSSDGTVEFTRRQGLKDSRIVLKERAATRGGGSVCRNIGVTNATGEYVVFLDSDDLLAPTCLEGRLADFAKHVDCDFLIYPTQLFSDAPGDSDLLWNSFSDEEDLDRFIRCDAPWQTTGPMWRRSALATIGAWDEEAHCWQDWEFHCRALAMGLKYRKMSRVDNYYRLNATGNISGSVDTPRLTASKGAVCGRVFRYLDDTKKLNASRRNLATQYMLRQAMIAAIELRNANITLEIWKEAWSFSDITTLEYLAVKSALGILATTGSQRAFHAIVWRMYRQHYETSLESWRNRCSDVWLGAYREASES